MALTRIAAIAMLGLGVSCVGPGQSEGVVVSPSAAGSLETATADCPNIELRSPAGNPVNLSGTWYGDNPAVVYYFTQSGECIWWAGGFATSSTSPSLAYDGLGGYTSVFAGRIASDFRIRGTWTIVRSRGLFGRAAGLSGTLEIQISFTGSGADETVTLTRVGRPTEDQRDHPDSHWTRISNTDVPPP